VGIFALGGGEAAFALLKIVDSGAQVPSQMCGLLTDPCDHAILEFSPVAKRRWKPAAWRGPRIEVLQGGCHEKSLVSASACFVVGCLWVAG
jgi:hypothetical protein